MFTHLTYTRRPVITYRRKAKFECTIDSSDDDSDHDDRRRQQQQPPSATINAQAKGTSTLARSATPVTEKDSRTYGEERPKHAGSPAQDASGSAGVEATEKHPSSADTRSPQLNPEAAAITSCTMVQDDGQPSQAVLPGVQQSIQEPLCAALDVSPESQCREAAGILQHQPAAIFEPAVQCAQTPGFQTYYPTHEFAALQPPEPLFTMARESDDLSISVIQPAMQPAASEGAATAVQAPASQSPEAFDVFAFPSDPNSLLSRPPKKNTTTSPRLPSELNDDDDGDIFEFPSNPPSSMAHVPSGNAVQSIPDPEEEEDVFAFPPDKKALVTHRPPTHKAGKKPYQAATTTTASPRDQAMDIFDFPEDDDQGEIRVMVASRQRSSVRSGAPALLSASSSSSSSISFSSSSPRKQGRHQKSVRFAPDLVISTFHKTSLAYSEPQLYPMPTDSELSREAPAAPTPAPASSSKRKRNLVSRLKSATGLGVESNVQRYDFAEDFDDEDETSADVWTTPESPERDENNTPQGDEWMQLIEQALDDDMDETEGQEEASRPRYQPQNSMSVKVTYARQSRKQPRNGSNHQDQELADLDNLLATLRNCK